MTDLLPAPEGQVEATGPLPIAYAPPPPAGERRALRTASLVCGLLFFVAVVAAGVVHPDIPAPLLIAFPALPLAAVLLGAFARPRPRAVIALGGVELGLVMMIAVMLPSLCRAREPANRVKCDSNLKQIYVALSAYADRHGGQFPAALDTLISDPECEITTDVLICPSSMDVAARGATPEESAALIRERPEHLSYLYAGAGLTRARASASRAIACDRQSIHKDNGVEVLFGDGHVETLTGKAAGQVMARLRAATRPALTVGPGRED